MYLSAGRRAWPPCPLPQVVWTTGATSVAGSLGAPLFDAASKQVVGVLVASTSSCAAAGRPDYFGRLSAVRWPTHVIAGVLFGHIM